MTQPSAGITRRRLFQGAGGLAATTWLLPASPGHAAGPAASAGMPEVLPARAHDLTVRWLHVLPRIARSGLVAAWPCDEGSGYACQDVTGHGHTFHLTGSRWNTADSGLTSAFRRAGRRGGGIHLDGTRWLQARHAPALQAGTRVTVTAWLRPDALPDETATILAHDGDHALVLTAAGGLRLTCQTADGAEHTVATRPGAVPAGRWSHVAATADAGSGRLEIHIDGDLAAEAGVAPYTPAVSAQDLVAGRGLNGDLDEITLHDRPLGAVELRHLYLVGLPKLFPQTRETIDADRRVWTGFKGSEPIPHPVEPDTVLSVRFDGTARSEQGHEPLDRAADGFVPGAFGAAWDATGDRVRYRSPLTGDDGTFEAWVVPLAVAAGARPSGEVFRASGEHAWLALVREERRWRVDIGAGVSTQTLYGPEQSFTPETLEHVAVAWGSDADPGRAVALYVNGVEVARREIGLAQTRFDQELSLGGGPDSAAYLLIDDVRVSGLARSWGEVCPRGHAVTDAAGLDLRDGFDRPDGTVPRLWRAASGRWNHRRRDWVDDTRTGDDPGRSRSLHQAESAGRHTAYHPDAYGHASSIEAGVSFPEARDGWAGIFVQASSPDRPFDGYSFMINPSRGELRLAWHEGGAVATDKTVRYDFPTRAETTYELTLTAAGDGVLRGYVDGNNLISMRSAPRPRSEGYAGLVTEGTAAFFDDVHVTALTPPTPRSRLVEIRVFGTGGEVGYDRLSLEPFRWHKRPGVPPWRYTAKNPEPAGNIAGADTESPPRPIPPAFWRSEDSANSALITVDERMIYFMRGNPRVDEHSYGARIGALHTAVDAFDGVHFEDPSQGITDLDRCKLVQGWDDPLYPELQSRTPQLQVNNPGCAYVGDGRVLVFMNEFRNRVRGYPRYRSLVYSYYDARANDWVHDRSQYVTWSTMDPDDPEAEFQGLMGTPELVALRDPDTDAYHVVIYHQSTDDAGHQAMTTTGLRIDSDGVPQLDPERPSVTSITRTGTDANGRERATKAIYSFRVLFDNGIYYLQYAEGPRVPDWPTHFVLCAALDPYQGPWVRNEDTNRDDATYFRRGGEYEPDNAAIWQGSMVKHRGHYYMYYETFHAIDDVDRPYQHYDHPHTGSRVGFATAT